MKFGKNTLFAVLVGLEIVTNVLELTHTNFLDGTTLLACYSCLLLPGFLLSLILRIRWVSFWENLLFILGLSIAFLEFGGLLLNILLPLLGVKDPLSFQNLFIGFNIYICLLFVGAWLRTQPFVVQLLEQAPAQIHPIVETSLEVPDELSPATSNELSPKAPDDLSSETSDKLRPVTDVTNDKTLQKQAIPVLIQLALPRFSKIEKALYTIPILFPIVSALGAIVINNGGSNILTLILLGSMAFYTLLLVLLREKIAASLYPYAIFFIGLASLFMTSLRSWYITGHDIEREFYVFQLTNTHHIWSMSFYQDVYSACLSITILPTVLTNLLLMQDMYVYKILFQIIFAFLPVLVFFILKKYTTPVLAFLSAFFFISFPTFSNDMPMLNRQEIGFLFFGLVLYMMLLSDLPSSLRKVLFAIFGISVILSHYSTNFVLLALVAFVYIFSLILSRSFVKKTLTLLLSLSHIRIKNTFPQNTFLTIPLVLLLFFMTYLWNTVYTNSSDHTGSVLVEVIGSLFVKSNDSTAKSTDVSYSLFSSSHIDPNQELQEYIQSAVKSVEALNAKKADVGSLYSKSVTSKYPVHPEDQEQLAPTPLGNWLSSLGIPVFDVQAGLRSLSAAFMQIFVFVGLFVIFFVRQKKIFDLQYILLCFGAIFLLVLIIVLPALSVEYGLLRMFQQLLFVLALPIVLGLSSVLFFVKEQKRIIFTGIVAVIFFLNLTGFISHLTGEYYPQMTLDNAGLYYDAYYVHKADVLAIIWLSKNDTDYAPVDADFPGVNKLLTYGHISALDGSFPEAIQVNAYVYLEISNQTSVSIGADTFFFNSPKPFLDANKNTLYSNGKDNIYK